MGPLAAGWKGVHTRAWHGAEHPRGAWYTLTPSLPCRLQYSKSWLLNPQLSPLLWGPPPVNHSPVFPPWGGRSQQEFRACPGQALGQPVGAQHPITIPPPSDRNYKHFVSTPVCPSSRAEGKRLRSGKADSLPITPAAAIPHAVTCNLPARVTSGEAIPSSPEQVPNCSFAE